MAERAIQLNSVVYTVSRRYAVGAPSRQELLKELLVQKMAEADCVDGEVQNGV